MSAPLEPLTFPLSGSRLIEASAGTGKTYTIAALYLRLILQHGGETAFPRPLLPPQILVMTFTEAATQELRDRIRARLVEAAHAFRQPGAVQDPFLDTLRQDIPQQAWAQCAWRLETAAQWMDEAAVMTLHSWCQRMLREHAFDSGSLFDLTVKASHQELLDQVLRDYWRTHCYPLNAEAASWVMENWEHPRKLWSHVQTFVLQREVDLPAEADGHEHDLQTWFDCQQSQLHTELARLKQQAHDWVGQVFEQLDAAREASQINGQKFRTAHQEGLLSTLQAWLNDASKVDIGYTDAQRKRLSVAGLKDAWKDAAQAPDTPALRQLEALPDRLAALRRRHDRNLLWHVVSWVRQRFVHEKRQRAEMGFADMLLDLRAALKGPAGSRLAATVARQFPVAMVDEFQDTDPVQYEILDAIYHLAHPPQNTALILIGDPKQSIYGFRGADIHAYLRAREATQGRHYTLPTNYRSSRAMVAAVNHLFGQAEQRAQGQGAFLFRSEHNPLPFQPVRAHHDQLSWQREGQTQPALTFWLQTAAGSADTHADAAACCATAIVSLLNDPSLRYTDAWGEEHAVTPADMAVLVSDRYQAAEIRQALRQRGLPSVYLSNADSVYQSQEALDMQFWLAACLQPQDERALKSALATPTLALSRHELERHEYDEQYWDDAVMAFSGYGRRWQTHGILPMVRQLIHDYALPQRLMRQHHAGERVLTNVLHLAEILQQQARELDGQRALLQFLQEAIEDPGKVEDEQVLRLESDAMLLRVVTLHKSKGLEYPFVFLPFINRYRPSRRRNTGGLVLNDAGERGFHFYADMDDALLQRVEAARLAEDLRLLYVAITRARYGCWVGVAPAQAKAHEHDRGSALGYLLGVDENTTDWSESLSKLVATASEPRPEEPVMALQDFPVATAVPYQVDAAPFTPRARSYQGPPRDPWWVASYSALQTTTMRADQANVPDSAAAQVLVDDEPGPTVAPEGPPQPGIHGLARGAATGNFLHAFLERAMQLEQHGDATPQERAELRASLLEQLAQRHGMQTDGHTLQTWAETLWNMSFRLADDLSFSLGVQPNCLIEMEFWLPATGVSIDAMDDLIVRHVQPGLSRPALRPGQINGLFKGFIDLVFQVDDRYYVLDYKSNYLGPSPASYVSAAMWDAMLIHRYDVQLTLYVLALHRHLQSRIPDYDYDRHMGGAVYLFLRGIEGPEQGMVRLRPPRQLIETLDCWFATASDRSRA